MAVSAVESYLAPLSRIPAIGAQSLAHLARLLLRDAKAQPLVKDLLFHLPVSVVDRRFSPPLSDAPAGVVATFLVKTEQYVQPPRAGRQPFRVLCKNETGMLQVAFFNGRAPWIKKRFPLGVHRVVSGKVEFFNGLPQISHPDIVAPAEDAKKIMQLEVVYPLTAGLTSRQVHFFVRLALDVAESLPEWLPDAWVKERQLLAFKAALARLHHPKAEADDDEAAKARHRLKLDEIYANQLALSLARRLAKKGAGFPVAPSRGLKERFLQALPFTLTGGQMQVVADIEQDMLSGERMLRLLQGDVGSGKTAVALVAAALVLEAGGQVAIMAPTDILARQHAAFFTRILSPLGIRVALLTGKTGTAKERKALRESIAAGQVDMVIGTHALFQESVAFKALGLVVVDEQHRFGVAQRMMLAEKGDIPPHILLMTATPIPRSLTLTLFGDMDCSLLREKPKGRQKITTSVMPLEKHEQVKEALQRVVAAGEKVYWICPLVQEKEDELFDAKADIAAAEARFAELSQYFGSRVALAHGKMKVDAREQAMRAFAGDGADVLVATTVVEVGVDVPEATVMVIEHAERFGLSQLHQLRGRVGRGDKPSTCILLYKSPLSEQGKERLSIMRGTDDGFVIAEKDLQLRGAGEILGTRQSGMPELRFAALEHDAELIRTVRHDVERFMAGDGALQSPRGHALRQLLALFGYADAVKFLHSG